MTADSYGATRAARWWVLPSQAAAGTSPALTPPPRAFRVCASPAATMRPSTRTFLAAFRSRSWVTPHSVQVQDLTARGFIPELNPHPEHSRLDGNQRLTPRRASWHACTKATSPSHCRCGAVLANVTTLRCTCVSLTLSPAARASCRARSASLNTTPAQPNALANNWVWPRVG